MTTEAKDPTGLLTAPESPPAPDEKKGRGPTRPAVRAADLIDDLHESLLGPSVLAALASGRTAKEVRAKVKDDRAALKRYVAETEDAISEDEALASFLARAEELPESMRRLLVAALSESEPTK